MGVPLPNPDPRFDADGEEIVRMFFSPEDLRMFPEEYAARHAQNWALFSFHLFCYRNAALGAWIRRLAELLFDEDRLEHWRERLLTPEEQAEVRRRAAEEF
jgi:hypothetical protein